MASHLLKEASFKSNFLIFLFNWDYVHQPDGVLHLHYEASYYRFITSASTLEAKFGYMCLRACFSRSLSNSITGWCIMTVKSRLGIFEFVHMNISRVYFSNSMQVSFSFRDIFQLLKIGLRYSSIPRWTSCSSSRVGCPPSSN